MNSNRNEYSRMIFADLRNYVASDFGASDWITLYEFNDDHAYFCALVDADHLDEVISNPSWEDLRFAIKLC